MHKRLSILAYRITHKDLDRLYDEAYSRGLEIGSEQEREKISEGISRILDNGIDASDAIEAIKDFLEVING